MARKSILSLALHLNHRKCEFSQEGLKRVRLQLPSQNRQLSGRLQRKSELPIRVNPDSVRNSSVEPFARREQDVFRWRDPGCEPSQTPLPTAMHAIPNVPQREVI